MRNSNGLVKALQTDNGRTENGMVTHTTTDSFVLNLFNMAGASRNLDEGSITRVFSDAWKENRELTLKTMFWARDIRGGAGERRIFRLFTKWLATNYPEVLIESNILDLISLYGRWDDLFEVIGFSAAIDNRVGIIIKNTFVNDKSGRTLLAKWMPREKSSKRMLAQMFRNVLGLTPKQYRKLLSSESETVEQLMCAKKWDKINFEHVPSYAMLKLKGAFYRNVGERFEKYIEDVKAGKKVIKSTTLYPYDIVRDLRARGNNDVLNAQWKALPNYLKDIEGRMIMPIIDTSGSMTWSRTPNVQPICISLSLGIYLAERNVGPYQDYMYIYSATPRFIKLSGETVFEKMKGIPEIVASNTNLEAVFVHLLNTSVKFKVKAEDMPTHLLIISDMEFDQAFDRRHTALDMIKVRYEQAGYATPKVIFWNVNSRSTKNLPAKADDQDVALVSGASPAIMKSVLTGTVFTPYEIMMHTITSERYEPIKLKA